MEYKEFLNQIQNSLKDVISNSGMTYSEIALKTKIKKKRLNEILNGKENIYINEIFSIARAVGLIALFDFNDNYIISDEERLYWNFKNYNKLINDLKFRIENCSKYEKEYYSSKIKILQKNEKSYNMLRFLLCNRIDRLMRAIELTSYELSDLLNVTRYYLVGVLNGEENFPCSLLFNILSIIGNPISLRFEKISEKQLLNINL